MPIKVKCACGTVLNAPDKLAGKKAKCPGCQQVIQIPVPAVPIAGPSVAAPAPAAPATAESVGCPSCKSPAPEGSVICVQCGYNFKTGQALTTNVVPEAEPEPELEPEGEAHM